MAIGISPKLPLATDETDGAYELNKNFEETVQQNFKMLLLTSPGERVMNPDFGVGLKHYLFKHKGNEIEGEIYAKINQQITKYLPFIKIIDMNFFTSEDAGYETLAINTLYIRIRYLLVPLDKPQILDIDLPVSFN